MLLLLFCLLPTNMYTHIANIFRFIAYKSKETVKTKNSNEDGNTKLVTWHDIKAVPYLLSFLFRNCLWAKIDKIDSWVTQCHLNSISPRCVIKYITSLLLLKKTKWINEKHFNTLNISLWGKLSLFQSFSFTLSFSLFLKVIPGVDFIIDKADSTIMRKLFLLFTSFKREPKGFDFYLIFNLL